MWYGHAGARYFSCNCGRKLGDVDTNWKIAREHLLVCRGKPDPTAN